MGVLRKTFLFSISLFFKCCVMATLPLGEMDTEMVGNDNNSMAINVTLLTVASDQIDGDNNDDNTATNFGYDGRIIGGQVTSIANYPYQVSLQHQKSHICGGSILTPNVILTAAHCIEDPQDVGSFHVRAGSSSHHRGGQLIGVRQIIKHESYTLTKLDCDVALLVLSRNLTFTRKIKPVELAVSNAMVPNQEPLMVSGWGLTSETGSVSGYLNHVAVRLINRHNCAKNYQFVATITRQMFCAGYPQGGKDSCQGDSGGPLVSYVATKATTTSPGTLSSSSSSLVSSLSSSPLMLPSSLEQTSPAATAASVSELKQTGRVARTPIQYGIVSWGVGCAHPGYPGVYSDVGALRPWINAKLREISYMYNK